jgi:uncharacterized repeat protein (TIGR03803 family)
LGHGVVYSLTNPGPGWIYEPIYNFGGLGDGEYPQAGITVGGNGILYGTTNGSNLGSGSAYKLQAPQRLICGGVFCEWNEDVLHDFSGEHGDGASPAYGNLIFDQYGNFYDTTEQGGVGQVGTVYQLSPTSDGWVEAVLYSFQNNAIDGKNPVAGLVLDEAGNLYGTTKNGGLGTCALGCGTVFKLSPNGNESILYHFGGLAGESPRGTLAMDAATGNLYGTTYTGGANGGGTVFELYYSNGWNYQLIYAFADCLPLAE